MQGNIP